jgi:cell wall-associated NlpC family hydrolase
MPPARAVVPAVNTNGQISRLRKVTAPQPGDLVFFGTNSTNTHHVGIYVGNGRMINALMTGTVIRQDPLLKDFVGYYRY